MKGDRLLYALLVGVAIIAGIAGFAVSRWTAAKCPEIVPHTDTMTLDSSARATIYAEGFIDGQASVVPEIRTVTVAGKTRTETVYDPSALEEALRAYAIIDSLMTVIGERDGLTDIVAHDVVEVPDHRLELVYRIRERSFRESSVVCLKPETVRTVEIPEVRTWWDRWGFGAGLGPAAVYVPGEGLRAGIGLTVGITYEF